MSQLYTVSQGLKNPLHTCGRELIGECMIDGEHVRTSTVEIVARFALAAIAIWFTIPLWIAGELLEILTEEGKGHINEQIDLGEFTPDEAVLDPRKTEFVGTAVSTFQSTSDPKFCEGSKMHDALKNPELGLGKGVDILTQEGRELTIQYLKKMHANSFRFSVEWADVKQNGFDKYVEAAKHFHEQGFTLFVTLDHWIGDGDENIFESENDIEKFVEYAKGAYQALRPYTSRFLTFNEPTVAAMSKYVRGAFPPFHCGNLWAARRLVSLKLNAHRQTHAVLHQLEQTYRGAKAPGNFEVGLTHSTTRMEVHNRWNILARIAAFVLTYVYHESFLIDAERSKEQIDVMGVQYYSRPLLGANGLKPVDSISPPTKHNPEGWMIEDLRYRYDPEGVLPILREMYRRIGKPLVMTEIGLAGDIDPACEDMSPTSHEYRKQTYYRLALRAMRLAQDEGIPLRGALFWTLFPNLEWDFGYRPGASFGIVARDPNTGRHRETAGFKVLQQSFATTRRIPRPRRSAGHAG
ncbi:MAG: 6-phospho-beta-galactosidase [Chlamydiia bacterium]|nr:6-phospho-beta-galactosidase [Chlamydiia bacterium]